MRLFSRGYRKSSSFVKYVDNAFSETTSYEKLSIRNQLSGIAQNFRRIHLEVIVQVPARKLVPKNVDSAIFSKIKFCLSPSALQNSSMKHKERSASPCDLERQRFKDRLHRRRSPPLTTNPRLTVPFHILRFPRPSTGRDAGSFAAERTRMGISNCSGRDAFRRMRESPGS